MSNEKQRPKKVMPVSPGRPKGVPNKLSRIAKDTIAQVFEDIGGVENMADWAKENPTQFYQIYAKLLPLQLTGAGGGPIETVTKIELVALQANDSSANSDT